MLFWLCDRLPRRDGIKMGCAGEMVSIWQNSGGAVRRRGGTGDAVRGVLPRKHAPFEDDELILPKHEDVINDLGPFSYCVAFPALTMPVPKAAMPQASRRRRVAIFLGFLASKDDCRRYELHRLNRPAKPEERNARRQLKLTRGLKNEGGLL
ncbi:hypothetical protein [Escherichia coli]|uniref:hypothetical protein n=1 Tax=Escherichia coli TaxID=562 RepID=UPI002FCD0CD4